MFQLLTLTVKAARAVTQFLFEADPAEQRMLMAKSQGEQLRTMGR